MSHELKLKAKADLFFNPRLEAMTSASLNLAHRMERCWNRRVCVACVSGFDWAKRSSSDDIITMMLVLVRCHSVTILLNIHVFCFF